jgi:CubicO group peptidase (beta-lactamase class C family)
MTKGTAIVTHWIVAMLVAFGLQCNVRTSLADDMTFPGERWEEAAPKSQSLDAMKLAAAADYLKANSGRDGVHELVIVRNGRIVWKGDNIDKVHGVWSCTKSFTSTVLGLLIEDEKCSLDTPAKKFVPELAEHYDGVTRRHFTTMTSGYRAAWKHTNPSAATWTATATSTSSPSHGAAATYHLFVENLLKPASSAEQPR